MGTTERDPDAGPSSWIGRPVRRVEDRPLLVGAGRYTDDLQLEGMLHVRFVRSSHAHARIRRLGIDRARAAPGVIDVVTGADARGLGRLGLNQPFAGIKVPVHPLLADDVARAVGEPIAAVVADTPGAACDGADRVDVGYEPMPAVVDAEAALAPGAPVVYADLGDNLAFRHTWASGDVAAAFAAAARVVRVRLVHPRLAGATMEARAVLAAWDAHRDELTIWSSTQVPFRIRPEVADHPPRRGVTLRRRPPDRADGRAT